MSSYSSSCDDIHYYQNAMSKHNALKSLISDYEENEYYKQQKSFKSYNFYVCLCLLVFVIAISYSALYLYEYYHPEMFDIISNCTNATNTTYSKSYFY